MRRKLLFSTLLLAITYSNVMSKTYPVVGTAQTKAFNNTREIAVPEKGDDFYGQNANYPGLAPSYTDLGDGTVKDNITGLIWQKGYKVMGYAQAEAFAKKMGDGWRIPSIKEVYSLVIFNGVDASTSSMTAVPAGSKPYIDTQFFDFAYAANGERPIDSQMISSTIYQGLTMGRTQAVFGLNLADGRIKGYPLQRRGEEKEFIVRLVKGGEEYGKNDFIDNMDGTISDKATGLMWSKTDSEKGLNWQQALEYIERLNEEKYLGYSDWRLPDAKELHTIVDYTRSPQKSSSAAIDPIFSISKIKREDGKSGYPSFWSSTTHENSRKGMTGATAVYISFGESLGYMSQRAGGSQNAAWMDVHGAGAQRSDAKTGSAADYPRGRGPQGDAIRIYNYVRAVR